MAYDDLNLLKPPKFRRIFVTEPTRHDLSALRDYSNDIRFLSSGYDNPTELRDKIEQALCEFDPTQDAIVPIGANLANALLGSLLSGFSIVYVGWFLGKDVKDYRFLEVHFGKTS